jgi:hypothetical protein
MRERRRRHWRTLQPGRSRSTTGEVAPVQRLAARGAALAVRLEGAHHIESRHLGARNLDPRKYARDRDLLLAALACDP